MYVFSRQLQLQGDVRRSLDAAVAITAVVNRRTGLQVALWSVLLGEPVGTVAFSTVVGSRAEFDAQTESLVADGEYLTAVAEIQRFSAGPPVDSMAQIVHAAGSNFAPAEVGTISEFTRAIIAPGKYQQALLWSIETADLVAEISGRPVLFMTGVAGPFGAVGWISHAPDMAATEDVDTRVNKDPRYLAKLDESAGLFLEGSGQRLYEKRIA